MNDLTSTSNPLVSGMRAASVNGKSVNVGRMDLKRLGESQSVRRIDDIIEEVLAAIKDWSRWAGEAGLCKFRTELF